MGFVAVSLGSNISSLKVQRHLNNAGKELSTTYERLSSGLRINKASDDAAGLAISQSLNSDRRVFNQGVRNLNDGVSLLNIADGAVSELTNIVVRLKELAEQSANGTYSTVQRKALDKEAQALSKEYTRIAQTTKFNDIGLLNGSVQGLRLQAGYGTDGGIYQGLGGAIGTATLGSGIAAANFNANTADTADFNGDGILDLVSATGGNPIHVKLGNGDGTFQTSTSYTTSAVGLGEITVGDFNGDGVIDIAALDSASLGVHVLIGNGNGTFQGPVSYSDGVAGGTAIDAKDLNGDGYDDLVMGGGSVINAYKVLISNGNGTFSTGMTFLNSSGGGVSTVDVTTDDFNGDGILDIAAINSNSTISVNLGNGNGTFGTYTSYSTTGNSDIVSGDFNNDGVIDLLSVGSNSVSLFSGNSDGTFQARVSLADGITSSIVSTGDFNGDGNLDISTRGTGGSNIQVGLGNGTFSLAFSIASFTSAVSGDFNGDGVLDMAVNGGVMLNITRDGAGALLGFDLTSIAGARQALSNFTSKLNQLSAQRGKMGAFQSRAEVALRVLSSQSENYAAAEGRISNADIADESSKLVYQQIKQQAATAVLAQANQQSSIALKLLKTE